MAVYFTADMHFDDDNIRRYENRPFDTAGEMNEAIIANWNSTVDEDDEVFVVGDVGNIGYISRLKGKKYLIKGNHDKLSDDFYREVFDDVLDRLILEGLNIPSAAACM